MSQNSNSVVVPGYGASNLRTLAALFKADLDDMFNAWDESKPLRTGMPHASAILASESDYCLRRLTLAGMYPDFAQRPDLKPWDSHQNAVFLSGWVLHEKYQDLFKKFGQTVELEKSHYDEVRLLHFTPDAIVEFANEDMVVEIKGYKASTFDKLDEMGAAPLAAHTQANFYMHLLGLQHALILVENKDTQDYKIWCVAYDRDMVQPQLDRLYHFKAALSQAKEGRGFPDRCCTSQGDRAAQKCLMRDVCFNRDLTVKQDYIEALISTNFMGTDLDIDINEEGW